MLPAVSESIDRFVAAARAIGFEVIPQRFPEGTRTAEDAARAIGCSVAQIVKSLVFVAGDDPVLALTSGANRVDVKKLASLCGAGKVRKANADEARAASGFTIGGTPPFGHPAPIRCFADPDLLDFDEIWAAAGTADAVFPIAPSELVARSGAQVAPFTEDA